MGPTPRASCPALPHVHAPTAHPSHPPLATSHVLPKRPPPPPPPPWLPPPPVYALGIYVDAAAAKGALSAFRKRPEEELQQDQAFYDGTTDTCVVPCVLVHGARARAVSTA